MSERGSMSLEQVLFIAAAIVLAFVGLRTFYNSMDVYLCNFNDNPDAIDACVTQKTGG